MAGRGLLSISKALKVLHELLSDSESEHSDKSDAEECDPEPRCAFCSTKQKPHKSSLVLRAKPAMSDCVSIRKE